MNQSPGIWQLQKAKAQLSALVWAAQSMPQIITRHGRPRVAMVSYPLFRAMIAAMHEANQQAKPGHSGLTSQNISAEALSPPPEGGRVREGVLE